jgi:hypothetical protein
MSFNNRLLMFVRARPSRLVHQDRCDYLQSAKEKGATARRKQALNDFCTIDSMLDIGLPKPQGEASTRSCRLNSCIALRSLM